MAKQSKGKTAARRAGRALKSFARGALQSGAEILGAGAMALNPSRKRKTNKTVIRAGRIDHLDVSKVHNPRKRIKVRNRYVDLIIKGQAKKTPQGWKVGRKTFAQGRGTVAVSSGYYLDRATGLVYAKRARNVAEGFYDASGIFHPIRSSSDYDPGTAGETGGKARKTKSKKRIAAKRKAASTARTRSRVRSRKATTSRLAARSLRKSAGLLKRGRRNPSAESIRKTFAGRVGPERDVYLPASAPSGKFAKLGKLVSITTEEGTIKPVNGQAVLLADTRGKLYIGSLSGANLIDGPARSFGQVKKIEYDESKPHLGYPNPIIWFHHMGEETGNRPTLHADGKGGLVFRGGAYRLTSRGIEN